MKSKLKLPKLTALVIVVAIAFFMLVANGMAQVGPNAITLATNRVTAATTNSTDGSAFYVGNQTSVFLLLTAYSTNTAASGGVGDTNGTTSKLTLRLSGSQDGTTYFENGTNWDVVYFTTGTNSVSTFKTLDASAVQYFKPTKLMSTTTNLVLFPSATYWYK